MTSGTLGFFGSHAFQLFQHGGLFFQRGKYGNHSFSRNKCDLRDGNARHVCEKAFQLQSGRTIWIAYGGGCGHKAHCVGSHSEGHLYTA